MKGSLSPLPAIGMLIGMLLLGFAGVIVIMPSSSVGPELTRAGEFLASESSRQLQAFGYITTSRAPSSFDSSDSSSLGSSSEPSKSLESGSLESSDWQYVFPQITKSIGASFGWLTLSLALQVVFAICYNKMVVDDILATKSTLDDQMNAVPDSGGEFTNGICMCHKDPWVCFQGLCCPMVRIAHTNAVTGVCPFWESLFCWCCCAWLTLNIAPFCVLMWWRLRLKTIMRYDDNPVNDFLITMVCPQLSICQMSSAVDAAMGYKMTSPITKADEVFYGSMQEP